MPSSRSHTRIEYSQSQYLYGYTITRKRILLHPQRRIKKGKKKKEEKNAQLSEKHEIMWSAHHFVQNFNFIYIMISITSIERSHYNTINDSTSTSIGPSNFSLSLHSHSCFSLNFFFVVRVRSFAQHTHRKMSSKFSGIAIQTHRWLPNQYKI